MTMQPDNIDPTTSEHPHPGPASASEAAIELIHVVMHQFRSMQFQALCDNGHGLTHMESKALGFFSRCPGATVSDLSLTAGATRPNWPNWLRVCANAICLRPKPMPRIDATFACGQVLQDGQSSKQWTFKVRFSTRERYADSTIPSRPSWWNS